jgi:hypothetical protein
VTSSGFLCGEKRDATTPESLVTREAFTLGEGQGGQRAEALCHSPRRNAVAVSTNRAAPAPNTGPCPPFGTTQRYDEGIAAWTSNASETGYKGS